LGGLASPVPEIVIMRGSQPERGADFIICSRFPTEKSRLAGLEGQQTLTGPEGSMSKLVFSVLVSYGMEKDSLG